MPDKPKTALVIFGAGASHDVVPVLSADILPADDSRFSTLVHDDLRPVLARHIFTDSGPVREALAAYPHANDLSATIRSSDKGLEDHLLELSRSATPFVRQGMKEMPLYLRRLFARISDYTNDPINYKALIQRFFNNSGFDQIAIVSLNYDLLLDRVLESDTFGGAFVSMESYDRPDIDPHLLYVKLHGSVNWAWRLPRSDFPGPRTEQSVSAYLDLIHSVELPPNLGDLSIVGPGDHFRGDALLYPALAIPTGNYEFICPDLQVKKLREFLSTCRNVLVIGCSARDQRFLKLLKDNLPIIIHNFVLVDSLPATAEIAERLFKRVPQLSRPTVNIETYDAGFSKFLRSGGLDKFIAAASSSWARSRRPAGRK